MRAVVHGVSLGSKLFEQNRTEHTLYFSFTVYIHDVKACEQITKQKGGMVVQQ